MHLQTQTSYSIFPFIFIFLFLLFLNMLYALAQVAVEFVVILLPQLLQVLITIGTTISRLHFLFKI